MKKLARSPKLAGAKIRRGERRPAWSRGQDLQEPRVSLPRASLPESAVVARAIAAVRAHTRFMLQLSAPMTFSRLTLTVQQVALRR